MDSTGPWSARAAGKAAGVGLSGRAMLSVRARLLRMMRTP